MGKIVITGGFTLDDTVLLSGEVRRLAPGGNLLYAAIGANIWCDDVAMFGLVGSGYPQAYLDEIEAHGIDISGLTHVDAPAIKVWALHEGPNQRQLIYKLDSGTNHGMDPRIEFVTEDYLKDVSALLIAAIPYASQRKIANAFRGGDRVIALDTINVKGRIDPTIFRDLSTLDGIDLFLPSLEEVEDIWGDKDIKEIMRLACENGKRSMAVKMGDKGCAVYDSRKDTFYRVPPCPVEVVDTTGAGDAFCGGFLTGYIESGDLRDAAVRGSVSASYVIQDFGGMHAIDTARSDADKRYNNLYRSIEIF